MTYLEFIFKTHDQGINTSMDHFMIMQPNFAKRRKLSWKRTLAIEFSSLFHRKMIIDFFIA
jgi:hypothetical protein